MELQEAQPFIKFVQFAKVLEDADGKHETYSIATSEVEDADGEICDFDLQKPLYEEWGSAAFNATTSAGQSPSFGPIRWQHDATSIAGKCTSIEYRPDKRQIWIKTQPVPDKWPLIQEGFVTGTSQGGAYVTRVCNSCAADMLKVRGNLCPVCKKDVKVRYSARIIENSYVDVPANPEARFAYVKSDGSCEIRKFQTTKTAEVAPTSHTITTTSQEKPVEPVTKSLAKVDKPTKRKAGEDLPASAFLIVEDPKDTSTWHLPVKFSTEEKSKRHVQNALARFNQVEAPAELKAKAWKKLLRLCKKYGIEVADDKKPADKAAVATDKSVTAAFFKGMIEKVSAETGITKGMYEVAWLANMIQDVASLQMNARWEAEYEGDGSDIPEELHDILEQLIDAFLHMAEEETEELTEHVAA